MKLLKLLPVLFTFTASSLVACAPAAEEDASAASDEIIVAPTAEAPTNASCSDARAELVYVDWRYQGGAPPFHGMVTGQRTLKYQGKTVGQTVSREGGVSEPGDDRPWEITLHWQGPRTVIERTGDANVGSLVFAQKVQATRVTGLGPTIDSNRFSTYVICTSSWNYLLP